MRLPPVTRRSLLGTAGALCAASRPAMATTAVPEAATLMAPGPDDGPAAVFANRAARGLARALVQAAALRVNVLGGPDGITAANRFAAATPADGSLLLVVPGPAGQAALIGDSRVRFDPRAWPAVAAALGPALLAGRGPLAARTPVRLALPGPAAPEAAAILALDLMGREVTPVFAAAGVAPEALVNAQAADAVVLSGRAVPARAEALGLTPWFGFDTPAGGRDPALPAVPGFGEALPDPGRPELVAAVRAAGTGLRLRGALVLPALTSSDAVALWRGAAQRWTEQEPEAEPGTRGVGPVAAAELLATLCATTEAAAAYRDWLHRRLSFQTG
jgi:hypothetical protein